MPCPLGVQVLTCIAMVILRDGSSCCDAGFCALRHQQQHTFLHVSSRNNLELGKVPKQLVKFAHCWLFAAQV